MFSDNYEYDYYIMVDGDNTYDLSNVNKMLHHVQNENFDMVIGKRVHKNSKAYRRGHLLGNKIFTSFVTLFWKTCNRYFFRF